MALVKRKGPPAASHHNARATSSRTQRATHYTVRYTLRLLGLLMTMQLLTYERTSYLLPVGKYPSTLVHDTCILLEPKAIAFHLR